MMKTNVMSLHYRHPLHLLGDVHPVYNAEQHRWFLYYLEPGGAFHSRLVSSRNLRQWREEPLRFEGTPRANYYVVAPSVRRTQWLTWYGQHHTHVCSSSDDGIVWHADTTKDIPVNLNHSQGGERDPYVVYDETLQCFHTVALAYLTTTYDCAITLTSSVGDSLTTWGQPVHTLLHFPNDTMWSNGEPECPQLMKIQRRWYIFASLARRTVHHVGGLSYWVGDLDKSPLEVNWAEKPRYELTSEDLCAAQLAQKKDEFYLFGWIPPQAKGNEWGGHLNIPLRVQVGHLGTLSTMWHKSSLQLKKTKTVLSLNDVFSWTSPMTIQKVTHVVFQAEWSPRTLIKFQQKGQSTLVFELDLDAQNLKVYSEENRYVFSSLSYPKPIKLGTTQPLHIIIEGDMLEVNYAQRVTLHTRLPRSLVGDTITTSFAHYKTITWSEPF